MNAPRLGFFDIFGIPPGGLISPNFLEGHTLGSNSQLNVFPSGSIAADFHYGPIDSSGNLIEVNFLGGRQSVRGTAHAGTTINLLSGRIGNCFRMNSGTSLNMSGGELGSAFFAEAGSIVTISAGLIENRFVAREGSTLTILGDSFEFNGLPVTELPEGLGMPDSTDVFTGVLQDGTLFLFATEGLDGLAGDVTLETTATPASQNPGVLSSGTFDGGLRTGETLRLSGDGALGDEFIIVGGRLDVEGGSAEGLLRVTRSEINVSGGSIGSLDLFDGSTLNLINGRVGSFDIYSGSTVNMSGGVVDSFPDAFRGSVFNLSGGLVSNIDARPGSTVNISGGTTGLIDVEEESVLRVSGGSTRIRVFGGGQADVSGGSTFSLDALVGSSVRITDGEVLRLIARSEDVYVLGGAVGRNGFRADTGSVVTISGGVIGIDGEARRGSVVNIMGGSISSSFTAQSASVINLSGGSLGETFRVESGSIMNVTGGALGEFLDARSGSTINISGGALGDTLIVREGSVLNVSATSFFLDGVPLTELDINEPEIFAARGGTLSGFFKDGSSFELELNTSFVSREDFVDENATLCVKLIAALADLDRDGDRDLDDIFLYFLWFGGADTTNADFDLYADEDLDDILAFFAAFKLP